MRSSILPQSVPINMKRKMIYNDVLPWDGSILHLKKIETILKIKNTSVIKVTRDEARQFDGEVQGVIVCMVLRNNYIFSVYEDLKTIFNIQNIGYHRVIIRNTMITLIRQHASYNENEEMILYPYLRLWEVENLYEEQLVDLEELLTFCCLFGVIGIERKSIIIVDDRPTIIIDKKCDCRQSHIKHTVYSKFIKDFDWRRSIFKMIMRDYRFTRGYGYTTKDLHEDVKSEFIYYVDNILEKYKGVVDIDEISSPLFSMLS